jgi:hypothetical protein
MRSLSIVSHVSHSLFKQDIRSESVALKIIMFVQNRHQSSILEVKLSQCSDNQTLFFSTVLNLYTL